MDNSSGLFEKTLNLDSIKNKKGFHKNCIVTDSFDLDLYDDVTGFSPKLRDTLEEGASKLKTFEDLSSDLFLSLFKHDPEMRDKSDLAFSREFNHSTLEEIQNSEEFKELRKMCKLDMLNSALGTDILNRGVLEKVDTILEESARDDPEDAENMIDLMNKMHDLEEDLREQQEEQDAQDELDSQNQEDSDNGDMGDMGDAGTTSNNQSFKGDGGQSSEHSRGNLDKEAINELAEIQEKLSQNKAYNKIKNSMGNMVSSAVGTAVEDIRELDEFVSAWGIDGSSGDSRISVDGTRKALERIRGSHQLKELTDILGRFKSIANSTLRDKTNERGHSIADVTVGDNIEKLLGTERVLLSNKKTKPLFYKKYNDKQLLQYEMENNKRKGKGPMVICLDKSGSMCGDRIDWAKAISLSLLEIAQKQKRHFHLMTFDTNIVQEWSIEKSSLEPNDIIDIGEIGTGYGTNFLVPVNRAMEVISKNEGFRKADIVFITDGDCTIPKDKTYELLEFKKKNKVRIQTIVINIGGSCSIAGVEDWSDDVKLINDISGLSDEGIVGSIFESAK